MRKTLILAVLLGGFAATPLAAQTDGLNGRVGKLEREMRAVQRKVFPGGSSEYFEPEITPQTPAGPAPGNPASLPIADLTARVDALESQLSSLTNQGEQNAFRLRQLEEQIAKLTGDTDARLKAIESGAGGATSGGLRVPGSRTRPAEEIEAEAPAPDEGRQAAINAVIRPVSGDEADDLYVYGFRLWQAKLYPEAVAELKTVVERFPKHRRASWAQNLIGRAHLDDGKPALASVAFYENYQKMPKGERAADSLVYLGQALIQLDKREDACKVYGVLDEDYGATLSDSLRALAVRGRADAGCK